MQHQLCPYVTRLQSDASVWEILGFSTYFPRMQSASASQMKGGNADAITMKYDRQLACVLPDSRAALQARFTA